MVVQRDVEEGAGQRRVGDPGWVAGAPFDASGVRGSILWSVMSKTRLKEVARLTLE